MAELHPAAARSKDWTMINRLQTLKAHVGCIYTDASRASKITASSFSEPQASHERVRGSNQKMQGHLAKMLNPASILPQLTGMAFSGESHGPMKINKRREGATF